MAASGGVRVFTRQATGLTKEIGTLDTFVYNVNNQNIGIGVAFILLFVPGFYIAADGGRADMVGSMLLAAGLAIPMALVYAFFAAAIPRSGGDYVYISRTLHPLLGFVASWNWVAWMTVYIGVPAAYFAQYGLSGMFRSVGVALANDDLVALANRFVDPYWILAIGTILIAFFAFIFARGTRVYFRLQNVVFVIGMIGVAAAIGLAILGNSAGFAANFDTYVAGAGGVAGASSNVIEPGVVSTEQTIFSSTWPLFIVLFAITSSFIGGEVRQARVSQLIGMPGGVVFVTIFMLLLVAVIVNLVGLPILGGVSASYFTPGESFGLSFVPGYNELVAAAYPGNVVVALLLGFTFVFWTYVWLPINFLASTRALLAWSLDGLLPSRVADVHPERHTPTAAIVIVAVLGWISLFMYTVGIGGFKINTLYGIFGWILSFVLCAVAAIVFPYRLRAVFDSSSVNWRIGGIPLMSIIGVVATIALLYVEWIWWADPINGLAGTPAVFEAQGLNPQIMFLLTFGVLISGALWYIGAWFVQRSRGVRIERAFAEIPPE